MERSSRAPIQQATEYCGVNPTNQLSRYSSDVPVLPAATWPFDGFAAVPVPPLFRTLSMDFSAAMATSVLSTLLPVVSAV